MFSSQDQLDGVQDPVKYKNAGPFDENVLKNLETARVEHSSKYRGF